MKLYREERYRIYLEGRHVPSDADVFDWLGSQGIDLGQSTSVEYNKILNRFDVVTLHEVKERKANEK